MNILPTASFYRLLDMATSPLAGMGSISGAVVCLGAGVYRARLIGTVYWRCIQQQDTLYPGLSYDLLREICLESTADAVGSLVSLGSEKLLWSIGIMSLLALGVAAGLKAAGNVLDEIDPKILGG